MNKKKITNIARVIAAIVTIASIYLFAPWQYGLYYLEPLPDTIAEELADATANHGADGVILYVDRKGSDPEYYAAGWFNRESKIPAYPEALFKIASIGKLYDAAAVTKLVAAGDLSLDKTLAEYLPDLVGRIEYAEQITIRMMVMHTSGIPNFTDQPEYNWTESKLDVLEMALDKPALFEPGTDYSYSNTNYLLLSRIVAKTAGSPYSQYVREVILQPLGLEKTYFSVNEVNMDDVMSGYYVGHPDDFKGLDQGMVATAEDVGIFLRALNDGSLLTEEEQAIYTSIYEYEHTGWVLGYQSVARYHADIDTVVIMFLSTTGGETILLRDVIYSRVMGII